jgi:hypothetical protein
MRPLLAAAQQGRNHGDTVDVIRRLGAGELGGRGQKVPKGPDVRAGLARRDPAGPDHGDAQPPYVELSRRGSDERR